MPKSSTAFRIRLFWHLRHFRHDNSQQWQLGPRNGPEQVECQQGQRDWTELSSFTNVRPAPLCRTNHPGLFSSVNDFSFPTSFLIDEVNVSITPVPKPSVIVLMLGGLILAAANWL